MRVLTVVLVVIASLAPSAASAQVGCSFQNGFKAMADQVPELVGSCVTNEYDGGDGTTRQLAAGGYFVWRASDNVTSFTAGTRTWVLGPAGVQEQGGSQADAATSGPAGLSAEAVGAINRACFMATANLMDLNTALRNYTTNPEATSRAFQQRCVDLTTRDGVQGFQCFAWTYEAMARRTASAGGLAGAEYERMARALYRGCSGRDV